MEFHSAAYTWKTVFKYPLCLLRPLGAVLIISVILLNLYPPPLLYGSSCCIFYNLILGGAIYTWFVNYMSPKHSIPLFVTLFLVIILSSNNDNSPTAETKAKSWMSDTFIGTFIPLLMGFLCGPVFLKLGKIESNMTTKPWIKFFWKESCNTVIYCSYLLLCSSLLLCYYYSSSSPHLNSLSSFFRCLFCSDMLCCVMFKCLKRRKFRRKCCYFFHNKNHCGSVSVLLLSIKLIFIISKFALSVRSKFRTVLYCTMM